MHRIIPFIIFFASIFYLFYVPVPMDKIAEIVKNRDCYQLKLMDQERLPLLSDTINSLDSPTASIKSGNDHSLEEKCLKKEQKQANFSLALSHRGN